MTRNRIAATLVATLALGAAAPSAFAEEQRALPPEQRYAYGCGHLGTDCGGQEAAPARKKTRRSCSTRSRRAAKRAGRRAERRYAGRCGGRSTRRAGARR